MSLEIKDAKVGGVESELLNKQGREVDHEEGKADGIIDRCLLDIHEILKAPELLSVAKIELDLESEPIEINKLFIAKRKVAAEEHNMCPLLCTEVGFDNDDDIEFLGKAFVQHSRLIDIGLHAMVYR